MLAVNKLTIAATASSIAASNVFTNCATETIAEKVVQIALIKPADAAVHLIFRSLVLLFICATWIKGLRDRNSRLFDSFF